MNCPFFSCLRLWAGACLLSGLGASPALAEMEWAQKTVQLKASAKDTVIEARFRFTNRGKDAVDIQQVESSCGCTTTALAQRHYAPGESGAIVALTSGGRPKPLPSNPPTPLPR